MDKQNIAADEAVNSSGKSTQLIDNRTLSVGGYLKDRLHPGSILKMVSAYFTIYGFQSMQQHLQSAKKVKFLYGDMTNIQNLDPEQKDTKSFSLTEESELVLNERLIQKPLAIECKDWLDKDGVEVRGIKEANLLHGKMYNITTGDNEEQVKDCVVGSSNFTRRGLGLNKRGSNYELNVAVTGDDCNQFEEWFDDLWDNPEAVEDIKDKVKAELDKLGQEQAPDFIYYKTLYEIFKDRIKEQEDANSVAKKIKFDQTEIWDKMYPFQQAAVTGIIHRLEKHNGCILADSVGLGKTYTALGVIKHYECQGKKVLVLCPKKLNNNWLIYKASAENPYNPFIKDKFQYTLLNHSDLTRVNKDDNLEGKVGDMHLETLFLDWYDLVVIDESHNFRNNTPGGTPVPNDPDRKKKTRYQRLMNDIIKAGRNTQVLMLSATPVNNTLKDLRNQIYLMCSDSQSHFSESIGINDLDIFFRQVQIRFNKWSKEKPGKREKLHSVLGGDYFKLLDEISLARSREMVKQYPGMDDIVFPENKNRHNKEPHTDSKNEIKYEDIYKDIKKFSLAIYHPAEYLSEDAAVYADLEEGQFKQTDRERSLIGMMRVNMLKRLESSAYSFTETLIKTIDKCDKQIEMIDAFEKSTKQSTSKTHVAESLEEFKDEEGSEDMDIEEFIVGKNQLTQINLKDMDLGLWRNDIEADQKELNKILTKVKVIIDEEGRDAKLELLRDDIHEKLDNPRKDKNGKPCHKILVFTAFADTADYLYRKLEAEIIAKGHHIALVTGSAKKCKSSLGGSDFYSILSNFSPVSQDRERTQANKPSTTNPEIDVIIATDCISEGQNLQDCDTVLSYDIHWNPVRLIQRFGRIDRIGSPHEEINMINYWPTKDLELYIQLQQKVRNKIALVDITGTGMDNPLEDDDTENMLEYENEMREMQLKQVHDGVLDIGTTDEKETGLQNFSLEYFRAQLLQYIHGREKQLKDTPYGLYAVTNTESKLEYSLEGSDNKNLPGIIFCLKQKNVNEKREIQGAGLRSNPVYPHVLVYVKTSGEILIKYTEAKDILTSFANLTLGKDTPDDALCSKFNLETDNGKKMDTIDNLLQAVQHSIREDTIDKNLSAMQMGSGRKKTITNQEDMPQDNNYELVTWLVIN